MSEQKTSLSLPADDEYFSHLFANLLKQVEEVNISADRLEEIDSLVRDLADDELRGERPTIVARKEGLSEKEEIIFSFLIQTRCEIADGVQEGQLSPKDAKKWRERFGFNPGGEILTTTEDLIREYEEELAQVSSQIESAKGRKLPDLLKRKKGLETILKAIKKTIKPTVAGTGTTGQASKRMSKGGKS
jgi:hypothetical protein